MSGEQTQPITKRRKQDPLAQQILLVMGFLGAVIFAGLVLVLQSPSPWEKATQFLIPGLSDDRYFRVMILLMAATSITSVLGSFAMAVVGAGEPGTVSRGVRAYAYGCEAISMAGLAIVLPMILHPFTPFGAYLILIFGLVMMVVLLIVIRQARRASKI
jgi:hypothetical protein